MDTSEAVRCGVPVIVILSIHGQYPHVHVGVSKTDCEMEHFHLHVGLSLPHSHIQQRDTKWSLRTLQGINDCCETHVSFHARKILSSDL